MDLGDAQSIVRPVIGIVTYEEMARWLGWPMVTPAITVGSETIRVLLIDENPLFLQAATGFLQRQTGLVVLRTAARLDAALIGTRDFQPGVIVLDPSTCGIGGLEIISRLRSMSLDVGVIVLALMDSTTYRQAANAAGADGFVSKANMVVDLLPAIRRAVQRETSANTGGLREANF